jgi:exoribonuclease R
MAGILQTKDYIHFTILSPRLEWFQTFEGGVKAGKAFHGDMVVWDPEKEVCTLQTRTKHYPLVGILEIASKSKYGMTSRGVPMYLFTPCRKEYPFMVVGCSEREIRTNCLAVVDFDSWETSTLPRGVLRTLLGPCGDLETEKQALLLTYNPFKMPKVNHDKTEDTSFLTREECPPQTFNIDPIGCRDIDDVLSIQETESTFELWITIADVAERIVPESSLDNYASLQGSTAYESGKAVKPMLPPELSEDACSLLPGSIRPGISLILSIDKTNQRKIENHSWKLTKVHNKKQYDYDSFINQATSDGLPIGLLANVASSILGKETADPHEWIEAFMLYYNKSVAKLLRTTGRGVLRNHNGPNLELLKQYSVLGIKELETLANKSANYCSATDPTPIHHGLGADVYCHASSPIRRYADLLNQRVLKGILTGSHTYVNPDILWLNQRQKDLKRYERDLFLLTHLALFKRAEVVAIVIQKEGQKLKLWISSWKRLITWKSGIEFPEAVIPGSELNVSYFANPASRGWKEKIVFRLNYIIY